jgi:hypothetical protein
LVAWLPIGRQLYANSTAMTLTLEKHVSTPSPKYRAKGIGTVAHILVRFASWRKGRLLPPLTPMRTLSSAPEQDCPTFGIEPLDRKVRSWHIKTCPVLSLSPQCDREAQDFSRLQLHT